MFMNEIDVCLFLFIFIFEWTYALFNVAAHTAPLCPIKVPTQSPVSPCRSIGFPSLHAEIKKYPSGVLSENERSTTGRVCPEQVNGV